jgi:hypothetical protein
MKVAQQFIAGFAFLNRSRPDRDDRVAFAPVKPRSKVVAINSIVPGGTARSKTNVDPALPCWATFIRSLRDNSAHTANRTAIWSRGPKLTRMVKAFGSGSCGRFAFQNRK